jgi:gliding motility-associated-like protein
MDNDLVSAEAVGLGRGTLAGLPITCPKITGTGLATTTLLWPLDCSTPPGEYRIPVKVSSAGACNRPGQVDSVIRVVVRAQPMTVLPPNVFTPNGDNLNDTFAPAAGLVAECKEEFKETRIFNRWGRLVFSSTDQFAGWTAANASSGMYFYFLEYSNRTYKGWVEVVR